MVSNEAWESLSYIYFFKDHSQYRAKIFTKLSSEGKGGTYIFFHIKYFGLKFMNYLVCLNRLRQLLCYICQQIISQYVHFHA